MSKVCSKCKIEKPFAEFHKDKNRTDGYHYTCRVCRAAAARVLYRKDPEKTCARKRAAHAANPAINRARSMKYKNNNRDKINAHKRKWYAKGKKNGTSIIGWIQLKYQGTPCMDCGGVFPWCGMDFDHRPEETKSFEIGKMGARAATPTRLAVLEKEIAKCDIVCATCHRIRTWERKQND